MAKKLIFMNIKRGILIVAFIFPLAFSNCQNATDHEKKMQFINNHIESLILMDIIEIHNDRFGRYPNSLEEVLIMYGNGETAFGFDEESLATYIKDPFTDFQNDLIYVVKEDAYMVYSVGQDQVDNNQEIVSSEPHIRNIVKRFHAEVEGWAGGDILIYPYE